MKRIAALAALAAAIVASFPPAALAGGYCRTRAIYSTYAAPSYSYSYSYAAPVYQAAYAVQEVLVPKAVKAYVSPDYYSSVSDHYRDKILIDAVAGRTQELLRDREELQSVRQELQLLRRQLLGGTGANGGPALPPEARPPAPLPQHDAPQRAPHQPMPPANGNGNGARGLPPVPPRLPEVVKAACLRCHGAQHAEMGGGLDLRDLASLPREQRLLSYTLVNTGEMPKGGRPLADADVLTFYEFATGRKITAQAPPK
jgi:hypothetical protein